MTVYEGCCGDEKWRGHNCTYHQGYEDAIDDKGFTHGTILLPTNYTGVFNCRDHQQIELWLRGELTDAIAHGLVPEAYDIWFAVRRPRLFNDIFGTPFDTDYVGRLTTS